MRELLIEIGTEELPALPFLKENIEEKYKIILEKYKIFNEFQFFYTPRRLVFFHKNFPIYQQDTKMEFIGAPKDIAIKDGNFTKAALSFMTKYNLDEKDIGFKNIKGKECLFCEKIIKGKKSIDILNQILSDFLNSLNFGKSMRWTDKDFEFIRPIRNLMVCFGDEFLKIKLFDIESKNEIFVHRSVSYEPITVKNIADYFRVLKNNAVVLDQNLRRDIILKQIQELENKHNVLIQKDKDLLDEIVVITEYPNALLGEFDKEFLKLPSEVIINSMKENQRYFPVFANDKLSNHFVVVSNAFCSDYDLIINGNERVLRARLNDAMFFYENDLSRDFSANSLKNINYIQGLGSIFDKEQRELFIANKLSKIYKNELEQECGLDYDTMIEQAIMLSKADLSTLMVGEFPDLQGVMGYYYALNKNFDKNIALAIKEQYMPDKDGNLPSSHLSCVVSMAIKLENLCGLFSINKIPNGNKDPYALRRAAIGFIKIIRQQQYNFDLNLLNDLGHIYAGLDVELLKNFILERIYSFFDTNPSIIKACLSSNQKDINEIFKNIQALVKISSDNNFGTNFSTFKRLANILKDHKILDVDPEILENNEEKKLYQSFLKIKNKDLDAEKYLTSLFDLKIDIDDFFENVMINVENSKIKNNRLNLIGSIYKEFIKIADIKEISF